MREAHCTLARGSRQAKPSATQTYHDLDYRAQTWPKAFRVVLKSVMLKFHLPSSCPVQALLRHVCETLLQIPEPAWNSS